MLRGEAASAGLDQASPPLAEREVQVAGLHNGMAAAIILGEWHFPEAMIAAIRDHYLIDETATPLAQLLNLAAGETERAGHGLPGETGYWELSSAKLAGAGISEGELQAATARARASFEALRHVVG